ncbi:MAG: TolC family protein [Saprospiraceae bacterium]|nr:TolC family protein [Saprospiraceae bacterium]MBK7736728.1 TolC family protein [Saprospiraceae bacterium]MBK7911909.1 TolC family protein [Saprospiraceae bacterium]
MKNGLQTILLLVLISCSFAVGAQVQLSLQSAIDTALFNNLGLIISKNEARIASNNLSRAQAGMIPSLDLNAGTNYSNNNLTQEFNTGSEINKTGVANKSINGQLVLNWVLFDGTKMFATYKKLQTLKEMGELNVLFNTESLISNVINAYAEIVKQNILLKSTLNNLSLYEERLKLADTKLKIGKSARSEFLQASLDLNIQKNNLVKQSSQLKIAKLNLNTLMMRSLNSDFDVSDSLQIDETINLEQALAKLESGNIQLKLLQLLEQQRQHEIKEQQSYAYPRINLNAGYNFVSSSSTQGLFLVNQSRGPLVGLTLNWNLYNGIQRKQVENSKLLKENVRLAYVETKVNLQSTVINAWQRYQDAIALAKAEQENFKLAAENLNIMAQRFKLADATILELKDAQQLNEAATTRLANSLFDAKSAETELRMLIGNLVQ